MHDWLRVVPPDDDLPLNTPPKNMRQAYFTLAALFGSVALSFGNLVVDPDGNSLPTNSFTAVTATGPTFTGWSFGIVSGAGSGLVEHDPNANFTNGGALYMTVNTGLVIYAIPTLSATLANSTSYTVSLNNSTSGAGTLTLYSGSTMIGALTGATPTLTFTTAASGSTQISFQETGNSDVYNVSVVGAIAATPEPNSIFAVAALAAGVCCVERRRLGGILQRFSRKSRLD
jgi:hypothetical protein